MNNNHTLPEQLFIFNLWAAKVTCEQIGAM